MAVRFSSVLALAYGCLFVSGAADAVRADCPSYTHHTAVVGLVDSLPGGWFVFAQSTASGLFKSDLKTYNPVLVPGTGGDSPSFIDISDDGKWIVYLTTSAGGQVSIIMITPTGKGRKQFPVSGQSHMGTTYPTMVRFLNASPKGNEIVYTTGWSTINAYSYTANDSVVTLGSERNVLSFPSEDGIVETTGLGAWKDQLLFESMIDNYGISRPGYITIPDNGNGSATDADLYQWANPSGGDTTTFGCGHIMSHDGLYCSSNAGYIGDTCVPCKHATENTYIMDHKGVYITPFLRSGSQGVEITGLPRSKGVSINWCPSDYWYGLYNEFDFDEENFTNNNKYIALAQIGNGTSAMKALKAVWALYWPTNTWTMLTPAGNTKGSAGTTYHFPAIHFTTVSEARNGLIERGNSLRMPEVHSSTVTGPSIELENGVCGITLYSLAGKTIWQYHRDRSSGVQRVDLPPSARSAGCLVTRFEFDK